MSLSGRPTERLEYRWNSEAELHVQEPCTTTNGHCKLERHSGGSRHAEPLRFPDGAVPTRQDSKMCRASKRRPSNARPLSIGQCHFETVSDEPIDRLPAPREVETACMQLKQSGIARSIPWFCSTQHSPPERGGRRAWVWRAFLVVGRALSAFEIALSRWSPCCGSPHVSDWHGPNHTWADAAWYSQHNRPGPSSFDAMARWHTDYERVDARVETALC